MRAMFPLFLAGTSPLVRSSRLVQSSSTQGGSRMPRKAYRSERIVVSFDTERCIHARYCVRGLPEVFDPSERPWVRPDQANPDRVGEVVIRSADGETLYRGSRGTLCRCGHSNNKPFCDSSHAEMDWRDD